MDDLIGNMDPQQLGFGMIILIVASMFILRKWMRSQTEKQISAIKMLHVDSDGKPIASNVEAIHNIRPGTTAQSMSRSEVDDLLTLYRHAAREVENTGPDGQPIEDLPDPEGLSRWFDAADKPDDIASPQFPQDTRAAPPDSDGDETETATLPIMDADAEDIPPEKAPEPPKDTPRGMTFKRKPAGLKTNLDPLGED